MICSSPEVILFHALKNESTSPEASHQHASYGPSTQQALQKAFWSTRIKMLENLVSPTVTCPIQHLTGQETINRVLTNWHYP